MGGAVRTKLFTNTRKSIKRIWCSGIIVPSHGTDRGSIPRMRKLWFSFLPPTYILRQAARLAERARSRVHRALKSKGVRKAQETSSVTATTGELSSDCTHYCRVIKPYLSSLPTTSVAQQCHTPRG